MNLHSWSHFTQLCVVCEAFFIVVNPLCIISLIGFTQLWVWKSSRKNSPSFILHWTTNTSLKMAHAINQKYSGSPLDGIRWCLGLCCYPGGKVKSWKPEYLKIFWIFLCFIVNIYITLCITTSKNHKWGAAVPNIWCLESLEQPNLKEMLAPLVLTQVSMTTSFFFFFTLAEIRKKCITVNLINGKKVTCGWEYRPGCSPARSDFTTTDLLSYCKSEYAC